MEEEQDQGVNLPATTLAAARASSSGQARSSSKHTNSSAPAQPAQRKRKAASELTSDMSKNQLLFDVDKRAGGDGFGLFALFLGRIKATDRFSSMHQLMDVLLGSFGALSWTLC